MYTWIDNIIYLLIGFALGGMVNMIVILSIISKGEKR
jgi:hypothetical protein